MAGDVLWVDVGVVGGVHVGEVDVGDDHLGGLLGKVCDVARVEVHSDNAKCKSL